MAVGHDGWQAVGFMAVSDQKRTTSRVQIVINGAREAHRLKRRGEYIGEIPIELWPLVRIGAFRLDCHSMGELPQEIAVVEIGLTSCKCGGAAHECSASMPTRLGESCHPALFSLSPNNRRDSTDCEEHDGDGERCGGIRYLAVDYGAKQGAASDTASPSQ